MDTPPLLQPLADVPGDEVELLLDAAFGPDRRARTAYRLRAGASALSELSFAAIGHEQTLIGSIQCWPVEFHSDDGAPTPMVLVGPVAVAPSLQRGGIGRMLVTRALRAAEASSEPGRDALMLIGDPEYYGRLFGFTAERTGGWRLPGPFEPHRLLALGPTVPAGTGTVRARVPGAACRAGATP
jgi:predicted N-acetyltransferase YhbS